MAESRKTQNLIVIVLAVLVIASSVLTTVYVSKKMASSNAEQQGYQNVTFTDATLTCEKEAKDSFGNSLSQLVFDSHSSRFDSTVFIYKIFLQAYVNKKNAEATEFYITCYVKSSNGRISKFEIFENVDAPKGEAQKQGGDKFIEWPQ